MKKYTTNTALMVLCTLALSTVHPELAGLIGLTLMFRIAAIAVVSTVFFVGVIRGTALQCIKS